MADNFLGEIRAVGFNFAPTGWATCDGQLLAISQSTALFSLLGTFYGGNGSSNFALPNLQGSVAMDFGNGGGLTPRYVGETGGSALITLLASEIPAHAHGVNGDSDAAVTTSAVGNLLAATARPIYSSAAGSAVLNPGTVEPNGGSQPHDNMQPTLTINYIIALTGIFPARG